MVAPTPVYRPHQLLRILIGSGIIIATCVGTWLLMSSDHHSPNTKLGLGEAPVTPPAAPHSAGTTPLFSDASLADIKKLTRPDLLRALAKIPTLPDSKNRTELFNRYVIAWANIDLPAAVAWAENLPSTAPVIRTAALHAVAGEALRTDALLTLRLLTPEPTGPDRDALLRRAAMELAVDDPEALATWADTIQARSLRDELISGVALVWSERDPRHAADLATTDLTAGRLRDDTLVGIAQRWVQKEPAQAAAWVASWPEDEARHAAIENVALAWSRTDAAAAERWLGALVTQADSR